MTIAVNLTGAFLMSQQVGAVMLEPGQWHGDQPGLAGRLRGADRPCGLLRVQVRPDRSDQGARLEWAGRGVTVNTISPTVVLTELGRKAWDRREGRPLKAQIPTGRFAYPEEIAAAAVFLASTPRQ